MAPAPKAKRYIIQLDQARQQIEMGRLQTLFEGLGIDLDTNYPPVLVSRKLGRYVVRGTATEEARRKAEAIPGIMFFSDATIEADESS